jgi:hypothetical protein
MKIETTNDGEDYTIFIEDSNKNFSFELNIVNRDNEVFIDYTNSDNDLFNLLTVTKDGQIIREVPELE